MVFDTLLEFETEWAAVRTVATRLGVRSAEKICKWVRQTEIDMGKSPGTGSEDLSAKVILLRREIAQLRQVIELSQAVGSAQGDEGSMDSAVSAGYVEFPARGEGDGDRSPRKDEVKSGCRVICPSGKDQLQQRISGLFPAGYLTLISIIQGVALAILFEQVKQDVFSGSSFSYRFTAASQALGVFFAIVMITHRYFMLTAMERWMPTHADTFLPYALGSGEAVMALMIGNNAGWWIALSVLLLAASVSFAYTLAREEKLAGDLQEFYAGARRFIRLQLINCVVLMLISVCVALFALYATIFPTLFYALAPVAIIAAIGVVEIKGERDRKKVYERHGFLRRRGIVSEEDARKDQAVADGR